MTLEFPRNLIQTQPRNSIYLRITIIVFVGLQNKPSHIIWQNDFMTLWAVATNGKIKLNLQESLRAREGVGEN